MSFIDAIKSGFRNYANFKGRAGRSEYWWWVLFTVLVETAASGFGDSLGGLVTIALLLPSLAVGVRRMHDTNHRGWWILFPIVNLIFLVSKSDTVENRFGPPPPPKVL
ncbi:MAG: DUF805 domain-containing protein [Actinobacteria bacterium]|nr:DUF805 domain-containing protein [Actinomycetota bacterium]